MLDIFLSYRRKDGESVAYLLYKDLVKNGYSVFFDHKSLGQGDFRSEIEEQIQNAKSVLLILSESSFSQKIYDENDVYRNEIKYALKYKKSWWVSCWKIFRDFPKIFRMI